MNISKKQEAQWSAMYEKLKQFKQDQGHLHVRGSDDQKLVYWIQNQRAKRCVYYCVPICFFFGFGKRF